MRDWLNFLRVDDIPLLARPSYAAELRHMLLWGAFASLIDGTFSGIVVAKTFRMPGLVPVVWATPMLAHLLSLLWGVVVRDRPKVRTFVVLASGAILSAGSIALTPSQWQPWGGWLFAAQIALSRIFMSGLVTVRTSIWTANYPRSHRAQIAGRIQALNLVLTVIMGAIVTVLFDQHAEYYRVVYPAIAVLGVAALVPLRVLRVRGEWRLAEHRERHARAGRGAWHELVAGVREAAAILKRDRDFSRYCTAQYLLGSANFMVDPILTLYLTQTAQLGYFGSYLLLEQLPTVLSIVTMPAWARLFDRVGVLRFRVVNSAYWLASFVLAGVALGVGAFDTPFALLAALVVLIMGRLANGLGRAGGAIAWNLGHLHFAGERDAELYLGIHIALTGLRGLVMPFVGTLVYHLAGPWALLLAVGLATAAQLSFRRLAREALTSSSPPVANVS